uniref:HTH gntR-type domain-containing protein n=1 Tax=Tanacetum cinerariifolium TaxID=118510 RepID=A0A699GLG3_TANCI|nr:hypothetical protein [Tanacetum cinerariifolium]
MVVMLVSCLLVTSWVNRRADGRHGFPLHHDPVHHGGDGNANKPRVGIDRFKTIAHVRERRRECGIEKAGDIGHDADDERRQRRHVPAAVIRILAAFAVQLRHIEFRLAHQVVVDDQDAGNRAQQRRVADQPREHIALGRFQYLPRHHDDGNRRRQVTAGAVGDALGGEGRKIVGRSHQVGGQVDRHRVDQQDDQRHQHGHAGHAAGQVHGIPDRLAVQDHRGRRHDHGHHRQQRHGHRQAHGLAHDLVALGFGKARKVGNVQCQRGPEAHHGGQRRPEHGPELARLFAAGDKLRWRRQQVAEAARLVVHPRQQHEADQDFQRRGIGFQLADRFHAVHDVVQLNGPESQKAQQLRSVDAQHRELVAADLTAHQHTEQGVDHLAAEPGLDAVPAAGHDGAHQRGQLGAGRAERRARQHRVRDAELGARVADQQHRQQHDGVGEEDREHRLPAGHAAFDQAGRQRVRRDAHHHAHPQRGKVVPAPRALRGGGGRQVFVPQLRAGGKFSTRVIHGTVSKALHRTGDLAQIAAHALFLDHLVGAAAGGVDELADRLVRRVFARHVAAAALDAVVLVDLGDDLVIHVQVFPVGGVGHRLAHEVADLVIALLLHPARQAVLHLFDDAKAMQHGGRAHLHAARTERHELGRVAPVADAADAGNGQAARGRIAGDFRHHVERNRLDGRAAVTAVGTGATDDRKGHHLVEVQVRDRVDGVDQRDRVRAACLGRARRRAHVGDVGRELDDHRQPAVGLAPARDHFHVFRHLAHGRAHAPFRHAVRAAEIELDAVGARRFHERQDVSPQFFFARQHQRDNDHAVRPVLLDLRDFAQGRVARRHVDGGRIFTQCFPHHAAPPGFEGTHHVIGLVGRRRGRQPERINGFDAAKFDAQIGPHCAHYAASMFVRLMSWWIACAASLPCWTACTRIADAGHVHALADGLEDGVGGDLERLAGARQTAADVRGALEAHAAHAARVVQQHLLRLRPRAHAHEVFPGDVLFVAGGAHGLETAAVHQRDFFRAQALDLHRHVDGGVAGADDDGPRRQRQGGQIVGLAQLRDVVDSGQQSRRIFTGKTELLAGAQAQAQEHGVVLRVQILQLQVVAQALAVTDVDAADLQQEVHFLLREVIGQLVFGDAVFVEATRFFLRLEHHHVVAQHGQAVRARQACRSGAHHRDGFTGGCSARKRVRGERHIVDRVALQQADFHRLPFRIVIAHADVFAQDFGGTHARAAATENILLEDAGGCAVDVFFVNVADEAGDVDAGGADARARCVVAVQAPRAFNRGLARIERRRQRCLVNDCLRTKLKRALLHLGECKFRASGGGIGPALHHRFMARIKTHAFRSVCMMVAEQAALPAAETVKGHRHRQRHVHAHHAYLDLPHEFARGAAVARVDRHAVAVLVGVDQLHRAAHVGQAHHAQDGAENFFLVDGHGGRDVIEQGPANKEAVLAAGHHVVAAIDDQCRALLHAFADQFLDTLLGGAGHDGPHFGIRRHAVAHFQCSRALCQCIDDLVAGVAHRHHHRDGHAALAGRAECCAHQGVHRHVHVGVGHYDHVILGAAQSLHALARRAAARINVFGNRRAADKAQGLDGPMIEQRIDGQLVALHDVEHAREHPHRHHHREVERRDAGHHAQRLAHRPGVDAARNLLGEFAFQHLRNTDCKLHHLDAARHFALGVGKGLAVFQRDDGREVIDVLLAQLQVLEQHSRARERRRGGPGGKGCFGGAHGDVHFLAAGQRHAGNRFAQCRVEDVCITTAGRVQPGAVDEMGDGVEGIEGAHVVRRRQGDDVARHADQHAVSECLLERIERARTGLARNGRQLDAGHQADAADVDHVRQSLERMHGVGPVFHHAGRVAEDVLFLEHFQRGQRGGARHRVARIRVTVEELDAGRRIHERIVDMRFAEHGAHGNGAVGQAFGRRHQVRLHVEIVGGKRRGQTSETGDHFVEDQQDAVLGAQFAQPFQVALGRHQHAGGSGHRLHDHGRDGGCVVQRDDAFQFVGQLEAVFRFAARVRVLVQVVGVRQVVHARQHHAVRLAVAGDAAHRDAAEAHPVVAPFAADQARAASLAARAVVRERHLERGVHGLGTGVGIEHVAEAVVGVVHQLVGQLEGGRVAHLEGGCEIELAHHVAHGGNDLWLGVAARHAPQAGRAVEDGVAVDILVIHAFGRNQQARIGFEIAVIGKRHPEGRHRRTRLRCGAGLSHAHLLEQAVKHSNRSGGKNSTVLLWVETESTMDAENVVIDQTDCAADWPVLAIERSKKGSLVDQIVNAIAAMVGRRELRIGTRMPSVRQFAKCNGISTFTVVESYDRLVTLGLLMSRRGSGYFVARQDLPAALTPTALHTMPTAIDALTPDLYSGVSEALAAGVGWLPPEWYGDDTVLDAVHPADARGDACVRPDPAHPHPPRRHGVRGRPGLQQPAFADPSPRLHRGGHRARRERHRYRAAGAPGSPHAAQAHVRQHGAAKPAGHVPVGSPGPPAAGTGRAVRLLAGGRRYLPRAGAARRSVAGSDGRPAPRDPRGQLFQDAVAGAARGLDLRFELAAARAAAHQDAGGADDVRDQRAGRVPRHQRPAVQAHGGQADRPTGRGPRAHHREPAQRGHGTAGPAARRHVRLGRVAGSSHAAAPGLERQDHRRRRAQGRHPAVAVRFFHAAPARIGMVPLQRRLQQPPRFAGLPAIDPFRLKETPCLPSKPCRNRPPASSAGRVDCRRGGQRRPVQAKPDVLLSHQAGLVRTGARRRAGRLAGTDGPPGRSRPGTARGAARVRAGQAEILTRAAVGVARVCDGGDQRRPGVRRADPAPRGAAAAQGYRGVRAVDRGRQDRAGQRDPPAVRYLGHDAVLRGLRAPDGAGVEPQAAHQKGLRRCRAPHRRHGACRNQRATGIRMPEQRRQYERTPRRCNAAMEVLSGAPTAAGDEAQQTQPCQQHGAGIGFRHGRSQVQAFHLGGREVVVGVDLHCRIPVAHHDIAVDDATAAGHAGVGRQHVGREAGGDLERRRVGKVEQHVVAVERLVAAREIGAAAAEVDDQRGAGRHVGEVVVAAGIEPAGVQVDHFDLAVGAGHVDAAPLLLGLGGGVEGSERLRRPGQRRRQRGHVDRRRARRHGRRQRAALIEPGRAAHVGGAVGHRAAGKRQVAAHDQRVAAKRVHVVGVDRVIGEGHIAPGQDRAFDVGTGSLEIVERKDIGAAQVDLEHACLRAADGGNGQGGSSDGFQHGHMIFTYRATCAHRPELRLTLLAAAGHEAQQAEAGQQHGIGFRFRHGGRQAAAERLQVHFAVLVEGLGVHAAFHVGAAHVAEGAVGHQDLAAEGAAHGHAVGAVEVPDQRAAQADGLVEVGRQAQHLVVGVEHNRGGVGQVERQVGGGGREDLGVELGQVEDQQAVGVAGAAEGDLVVVVAERDLGACRTRQRRQLGAHIVHHVGEVGGGDSSAGAVHQRRGGGQRPVVVGAVRQAGRVGVAIEVDAAGSARHPGVAVKAGAGGVAAHVGLALVHAQAGGAAAHDGAETVHVHVLAAVGVDRTDHGQAGVARRCRLRCVLDEVAALQVAADIGAAVHVRGRYQVAGRDHVELLEHLVGSQGGGGGGMRGAGKQGGGSEGDTVTPSQTLDGDQHEQLLPPYRQRLRRNGAGFFTRGALRRPYHPPHVHARPARLRAGAGVYHQHPAAGADAVCPVPGRQAAAVRVRRRRPPARHRARDRRPHRHPVVALFRLAGAGGMAQADDHLAAGADLRLDAVRPPRADRRLHHAVVRPEGAGTAPGGSAHGRAAGAGGAAFSVQHAGPDRPVDRDRSAPGRAHPPEPDRLPARNAAADARPRRRHAGPADRDVARLSRHHAGAHAQPAGRVDRRPARHAERHLPRDDAADPDRERHQARAGTEDRRRPHRSPRQRGRPHAAGGRDRRRHRLQHPRRRRPGTVQRARAAAHPVRRARPAGDRAAQPPARRLARPRHRGRSGQRHRGRGDGRPAPARHRVPRYPHAGPVRHRGCAPAVQALPPGVRHRLRPVCDRGVRAGRAGLPDETGGRRAPENHVRAPAAAGGPSAGRYRTAADPAAGAARRQRRQGCAAGLPALDPGRGGHQPAHDQHARSAVFPGRRKIHAGADRAVGSVDTQAAQGACRRTRPRRILAHPPLDAGAGGRHRGSHARPARTADGAPARLPATARSQSRPYAPVPANFHYPLRRNHDQHPQAHAVHRRAVPAVPRRAGRHQMAQRYLRLRTPARGAQRRRHHCPCPAHVRQRHDHAQFRVQYRVRPADEAAGRGGPVRHAKHLPGRQRCRPRVWPRAGVRRGRATGDQG